MRLCKSPLQVVWFKRDLRLTDHAPLARAAESGGGVLPLYMIEPGLWQEPDASGRHWGFIRECLAELDTALAELGQRLIIRRGPAVDVLEQFRSRHGIAALWSHEETGNNWTYQRDKAVAAWAREHGIPWHEFRQHGIERRIATRNGWAARWDRMMAEPITPTPTALEPIFGVETEPLPSAIELGLAPDPCPERQRGGRSAALERLHSFLNSRGWNYRREMSNPLGGYEACSRLSPHLALGTVSMREVAQATWKRQRDLKHGGASPAPGLHRAALVSFGGRLHWHCHFMQKLEDEPNIEFTELHPALRGLRGSAPDHARLAAWRAGETGYPFLDACMRSLAATGWLNFRMRAMVMSFASYNLWLPWRGTGTILAKLFTDYEPGIHWPQVQMQSGTTGINTIRIYNVVKQGYDQDPTGAFVRRWIPELAEVPDAFVHEPWRWEGAGTVMGQRYPMRVVELAASTKLAKERIYGARRNVAFHVFADDIQERHGSRKSGLPLTGRRRRTAKTPSNRDQLRFDL